MVSAQDLAEPLSLLEESLRDGDPVPAAFAEKLRGSIATGDIEILAATAEGHSLGVVILAYRLNVSAGGIFACIEDLYVRQEARRQGVGRALLEAAGERCAARKISYVEVQVEDEAAVTFYEALGYEPQAGTRVLARSLPLSDA